jgi:hypothetical protein
LGNEPADLGYTLDDELGAGIVVDSMNNIIIGPDSNQYNISLQSGVLASAHRTGVVEGKLVSADYDFTRNSVPAIEPPSSLSGITWKMIPFNPPLNVLNVFFRLFALQSSSFFAV